MAYDETFDDQLSDLGYRGGDVEAFLAEAKRSTFDRLYDEHVAARRLSRRCSSGVASAQVLGVR